MNIGIEHRSANSVLEAYQQYALPNFSIWSGKSLRWKYEGGNGDEGMQMLQNCLQTIQDSGTTTIYTIRVYPAERTKITSNTEYDGSTNFQLTSYVAGGNGQGSITIANPQQAPAKIDPLWMNRLTLLEDENKKLRNELHANQLRSMEERLNNQFSKQIAGLKEQATDKWEKFDSILEKHWGKVKEVVGAIRNEFAPNNYIVDQGKQVAVNGTKSSHEIDTNMDTKFTDEGALINPFLTPEQQGLKLHEKSAIVKSLIEKTDKDTQDDIQSECLEIIEKRISNITLTRMLLAVACLDNHSMNKLLSNLD